MSRSTFRKAIALTFWGLAVPLYLVGLTVGAAFSQIGEIAP